MRLLALAGLALASLGMGFGVDNRQRMPATPDAVWRTMGKIAFAEGTASGTLVGPHLVLTAKHCMFDPETGQEYKNLVFITAAKGPRGQQEVARVRQVYYLKERSAASGFPYDWALCIIDKSLGNEFGWLGVKTFDAGERPLDFKPTFYGYGANPHEQVSEFRDCNYPWSAQGHFRLTALPNLMIHDCASWPGSSGGALVVWSHGKPWVAGVHVAGHSQEQYPKACKAAGGFVRDVPPDPRFYASLGNICVAMDRPLETLKDLPIPTHHRLTVENQAGVRVYVGAVFHSDNYDEDRQVGYLTVEPGQTVTVIGEKDGCTRNELFFHAHAEDGYTWGRADATYQLDTNPPRPFVRFPMDGAKHHLVLKKKGS